MRKVYKDLVIVVVCVFIAIKYTTAFVMVAAVLAAIWFFAVNDAKKKEIKDKISNFFNR